MSKKASSADGLVDTRAVPLRSAEVRAAHARAAGSRSLVTVGLALLVGGWLAGCSAESPLAGDVVGTLGDEPLYYRSFEVTLQDDPEFSSPALDSAVLSQLFDQFLDEQLLRRLAADRGLDDRGDIRQLIEALLALTPAVPPDDSTVAAYYEAHLEEFQRAERVRLSQILVDDRAVAQEALRALAGGEEFLSVSARLSEAPNAHQGSDQGWLAAEDLPPAFVEAIFRLEPGETSGIVEAEYGFHIFLVADHQPARTITVEEAAARIREQLMRFDVDRRVEALVSEARQRYNVEIYAQNIPFEYEGDYATIN